MDYELITEGCKVSDRQAFGTCRAIGRARGLLIGGSSGGTVYEALQRMRNVPAGSTVVVLLNDGGEKYLDTVFDDDWMRARDLIDTGIEREVTDLLAELGS